MSHPFQTLPIGKRRNVFFPALVLLLMGQFGFLLTGAPLNTAETSTRCDSFLSSLCRGIIGYEFARIAENSAAILQSWDQARVKPNASFSLGIDYVYILGYANLIALACVWGGGALSKSKWRGANFGAELAWGAWLAGLLDMVENLGLLVQLFNAASNEWAFLAWFCATIKFILIGLCLVYVLYGCLAWLANKMQFAPH